MTKKDNFYGIMAALFIIGLWAYFLSYLLGWQINYGNPLFILNILIMTHLYTGIFITAHDAIHGLVSSNGTVNRAVGRVCTNLFAFNNYQRLAEKHHIHHRIPGTADDPDYYRGSFFSWFFKFLGQYLSIWQFILMSITFNLAALFYNQENLVFFWVLPAILSTFQLFYFGTYLPHRGNFPVDDHHKARSQKKNHFLAFISCYFFGYHYEHHAFPYLRWWQLPEARTKTEQEHY